MGKPIFHRSYRDYTSESGFVNSLIAPATIVSATLPCGLRGSHGPARSTVAFEGIEARAVDVQVQVAPGLPAFNIVGLPDKAVSEAKERVRAALVASGLALPARRITINLAPADLPKEGSHYDLPIALGLMAAIGAMPHDALARLHRAGRARPRRLDRAGRGRAARRDRRQLPRRRTDLPGGLRAGGGLGQPRDGDHRAVVADPARQPLQGHAGADAAEARHPRRGAGRDARPRRHQGPGERQARARGRRRRRAQSPDDRAARLRQVDAGGAAADHPADAVAGRAARSLDDRLGRRRDRRRRADQPAAVPRAASFRLDAGAGRRRLARAAGRSLARASRRAVPRRAAGIPAAGARRAAPAAGDRRGRDRARQPPRHLSGALHAGGGDEPVPLRPRQSIPASPAGAGRTRAAPPNTRRGCRARCSTASISTSRCRPSPPPT